MFPYLKEGDIVFFKKYKKNKTILKNQQIVIFNHPLKNKNLIKRINSVNKNNIEVIGDNIEFSEDSKKFGLINNEKIIGICLLYTSPSPRDCDRSRMPSSA